MTAKKPKRKANPKGLTLRQCAPALGISRPRLVRLVGLGLPVKRIGERYDIDPAKARKWIADFERREHEEKRIAPQLDPRDPRHKERTAMAAIGAIKLERKRGNILEADEVVTMLEDQVTQFRQGLFAIPAQFGGELEGVTADEAAKMIVPGINEAIAVLTMDGEEKWPHVPTPDDDNFEPEELPHWLELEPRPVAALLSPGDPRHALATTNAARRELQLAELDESSALRCDVLEFVGATFKRLREAARAIPNNVCAALPAGPHDRHVIVGAIDMATRALLLAEQMEAIPS